MNDPNQFARYRAIYEKNLDERYIQKNFEHPSPRFYLNQNIEFRPMPSISSIPKASIERVMEEDINKHPSIYKVTNFTPSPSPDLPESFRDLARLREAKVADFIEYQRQRSKDRIMQKPLNNNPKNSDNQLQIHTFQPLSDDKSNESQKKQDSREVPSSISESVAKQLLGISAFEKKQRLGVTILEEQNQSSMELSQSEANTPVKQFSSTQEDKRQELIKLLPSQQDQATSMRSHTQHIKIEDFIQAEALTDLIPTGGQTMNLQGLIQLNEMNSQASIKGFLTNNISQNSLINTGTKEISLKRFIEKNRELLLPSALSPISHQKNLAKDQSAVFALGKLAELEKTNLTRIKSKREDALNEIILPKLELIQIFEAFKKLAKNFHYLSGKEVQLHQRHRKSQLRNHLNSWHQLRYDIHIERENMNIAQHHHHRRIRVTCKLLLYKWKKLVKDENRELQEKMAKFIQIKSRMIFDTWKLMIIKAHCMKMREKYFKRKVLKSLKLALNERFELQNYFLGRKMKVCFRKWKIEQKSNKKLNELSKEWTEYSRLCMKRKCFDGLLDMIKILKRAKGDPFLIRSILGNFTGRQTQIDSEDETEFFEIQVRTQSQIINQPDFMNQNKSLSQHFSVEVLGLDQQKTLNLMCT